MKKSVLSIFVLLALSMLIISGCQIAKPEGNTTQETTPAELGNVTLPDESTPTGNVPLEVVDQTPTVAATIEATEGDLVELNPEAVDPDKDLITYSFTKPFNNNGKWQTQEGDAGKYLVTVTASDGKASTSQDVVIIIHKAKQAPAIECPSEIAAKEGDLINLNCNIYDPEGGNVVVEYSGFMKGPVYQTTFDDEGTYTTMVKAKNEFKESTKKITIIIANTNRAPEISNLLEVVSAMETETIILRPTVLDPDKDATTITYSEPFDSKGTWVTKIGDAGTYQVSIVASDGKLTAKKDIKVEVKMKNTAPVLKKINDITVYEGDTIKLPIEVTDREKDSIKVTVSGWMNSDEYTTTYDDAGEYTVTVSATDGVYEAKQTFKVVVLDKNRAPVFKLPA